MRPRASKLWGVLVVACCAGGVVGGGRARAAGPSKSGAGAMPPLASASLARLRSDDLTDVRTALDDTRLAGPKAGAAAVPSIVALLHAGLPYSLAEAAIDTLADLETPAAPDALAPYARHRDAKVRRAAIRALGRTVGASGLPVAAASLRAALSDPDREVRAAAATGLGSLKARGAVPDLFLALDHQVYEAAVSIGQLCDVAECDALVGRLGKIPFDVVTTGLEQLLFRPAIEVGDDVKVGVIGRVRDLGTKDANRFLHQIQRRWGGSGQRGSPKVKAALDAAVLATLSSPGSDP